MSLVQNGFEGQSNGATANGSNIANSGVTISFNRGTGSTTTYSNAHPAHGSMGLLLHSGASASCAGSVAVSSSANVAVSRAIYLPALPTGAQVMLFAVGSIQAYIRTNGTVELHDASGTTQFTTTFALQTATSYRAELVVFTNSSPTAGSVMFRLAQLNNTTAISGSEFISSTFNSGSASITSVTFGNNTQLQTAAFDDYLDDVQVMTNAIGYIGPWATDQPPDADAGPDQTGIEPYTTVTLDGTASSDPDNGDSIASYTWKQVSPYSPTVSLSSTTAAKPTFVAPATLTGVTLSFSLVVTDSFGVSSTVESIVSVVVLPHTIWRIESGSPSPVQTTSL